MNPSWTLAAISVLAGAATAWVFRLFSRGRGLRQAANRIQAHLLEFWLFVDEPALVWKSWRGLLAANARLLRVVLVPLVILSVPMVPLFYCMDSSYGHSPLAVGSPALVTIAVNQPLDRLSPVLTAPDGLAIESPPVRVFSSRQVSWRIRPLHAMSGTLRCALGGSTVEKSVYAGPGFRRLSRRRSRSILDLVRYPAEAPLTAGPVEWIEVCYPSAAVRLCGVEAHWSVWFIAFSLLGAVAVLPLARKRVSG